MKFQGLEISKGKGLENEHRIQSTRLEGRALMLKLAREPCPATGLSSKSQLSVTARCLASQLAVRVTSTRMEINLEGRFQAENLGQIFYLTKVIVQ